MGRWIYRHYIHKYTSDWDRFSLPAEAAYNRIWKSWAFPPADLSITTRTVHVVRLGPGPVAVTGQSATFLTLINMLVISVLVRKILRMFLGTLCLNLLWLWNTLWKNGLPSIIFKKKSLVFQRSFEGTYFLKGNFSPFILMRFIPFVVLFQKACAPGNLLYIPDFLFFLTETNHLDSENQNRSLIFFPFWFNFSWTRANK